MIAKSARAVIAILDPYHPDAVAKLQDNEDIEVLFRSGTNQNDIYERAEAVMLRSETRLAKTEFSKFSRLKYIVKQGVGVDNIDLEDARRAGIQVYNTPGLNGEAVAELALSLALCLARRVTEIDRAIRDGRAVVRSHTLGTSLFGKTLGIVGMGNIGLALAKKWMGAMEGQIIAYDPYYKPSSGTSAWSDVLSKGRFRKVDDLQQLLQKADVVTLHVPLNKSTKGLLSRDQFAQMKHGCILLNCARGGIIDEDDMLEALESGRLGGAGLDAMEIEPPTRDAYGALLANQNVIITPHIGASTVENQSRSGIAVADLAVRLVSGDTSDGNRVA